MVVLFRGGWRIGTNDLENRGGSSCSYYRSSKLLLNEIASANARNGDNNNISLLSIYGTKMFKI